MDVSDDGCATVEFLLAPRLTPPPFDHADVAVAPPPAAARREPGSPMVRLLPVVVAVVTAGMFAAMVSARSGTVRTPMFVVFPLLMLLSTAAAAVTNRRGREVGTERADYLAYLADLRDDVTKAAVAQRSSLLWCHPDPDALWTLIGGRRMWERRAGDPDFCVTRVGTGTVPLAMRPVPPPSGPADRTDPVTASALRRFLHTHSTIPAAPVTVSLRGLSDVTVSGDAAEARGLVRALVCQLAVLHSPTRLRIVGAIDQRCAAHWGWLKWLPHNQHPRDSDDAGALRMVYPTLARARDALSALHADHVVIVADGDEHDGHAGVAADGVTVLRIGDPADRTPPAGTARVQVTCGRLAVIHADGEATADADQMSPAAAVTCARRLAAYRPAAAVEAAPGGWPALPGIGDPAVFSPTTLWDRVTPRSRLRVPIGTTSTGTPLDLDIKEAAENGVGPHGLCIGATGSGKSEFLRTVAVGMIARHPPDALNLVLVDFKGGATFLGLEPAPHVAAVITNLSEEAPLVARMRDALTGEIHRRQELLRAAGTCDSVAAYQQARRSGARLAALPALFIIVDEFSELLSQQPDFADVFGAIGRLGRSLGMHLLLASQRLEESRLRGLESHLSYRVCLKTLSANESRIVLGTSDAYELPGTPGAGYLRTGSSDPVRFQTAFVSGPSNAGSAGAVRPRPRTPASVRRFTAAPSGPLSRGAGTGTALGPTVLQTVVDRVRGHGPPAHEVWLPPLGAAPALDTVLDDAAAAVADLRVPIGVVDRPFEQCRTPLSVEMSGAAGNVAVVGAPQSGKSTALRTLITALAATHDPSRVQFYCLDFGGGTLAALRSWPHVGAVAGRAAPQLAVRMVAEIQAVIRAREAVFGDHGIDSMAQYRRLLARRDPVCDRFGDVFLVVDGWAAACREFDSLDASITGIASQGLSFGVHVMVSASRWAELRPAVKDQIGTRLELRLGDPADSEMDRRRAQHVPEGEPGRGLSRDGLHTLIALPRLDGVASASGLAESAVRIGRVLRRRHGACAAPAIPVLPARVEHHTVLQRAAHRRAILLGLEESELQPAAVDFGRSPHLLVVGETECGKTTTLRTVCREIMRTATAAAAQLYVVDFRRTLLGVVESEHLGGYAMSASGWAVLLPDLLDLLRGRMPPAVVTQEQLRARSWWSGPDIYLVVDDYDLVATADGNPLSALLEFLPHAKDLGLHLVVARRSGGAARAMFEPLLAELRDAGAQALMMSASPDDGPLIGSLRPEPLPPGRGTLTDGRGGRQRIQVAWSPPP